MLLDLTDLPDLRETRDLLASQAKLKPANPENPEIPETRDLKANLDPRVTKDPKVTPVTMVAATTAPRRVCPRAIKLGLNPTHNHLSNDNDDDTLLNFSLSTLSTVIIFHFSITNLN